MKVLFKKYNQEFDNKEIEVFNSYLTKSFMKLLNEDKTVEIQNCKKVENEPFLKPKEENA